MEIVATNPYMNQKLLWIGVDGDAVSINGLRILRVIRTGSWALILWQRPLSIKLKERREHRIIYPEKPFPPTPKGI